MDILGIFVLIAVIVPASGGGVVVLALCKSMAITDDMNGTRG
jgi:hypothetical protein